MIKPHALMFVPILEHNEIRAFLAIERRKIMNISLINSQLGPPLRGQQSYPERGQKMTLFDPLPPSCCPRSY